MCVLACESACAGTFVWPEWGADVDVSSLKCAISVFSFGTMCSLTNYSTKHLTR